MNMNNVLGQLDVSFKTRLVQEDKKKIESAQKTVGKIDILMGGFSQIVFSINRIGRSQNRASRVESNRNPSLGNRNSLLLHYFVQSDSIVLLHLVEFVNAADSLISQNKGSGLQVDLPSFSVLIYGCSQPHSRGSLSSGVDSSIGNPRGKFEDLGLGYSGVPNKGYVDVPSDMHSAGVPESCSSNLLE